MVKKKKTKIIIVIMEIVHLYGREGERERDR